MLGIGAILYGGNFAVRPDGARGISLAASIARIEFHGEDTNLGRRLTPQGRVELAGDCWVWTFCRAP